MHSIANSPYQARVQPVDVRVAVPREGVVVMEALDDAELDVEPFVGLEHVVGALRRRDDGSAWTTTGRRRADDGAG